MAKSAMKKERQRIAIATACGWGKPYVDGVAYRPIANAPDYTEDLNAMHAAEKTLTGKEPEDYWDILADMVPDNKGMFPICHATAAQRAKSFLVVKGLWTE